MATITNRGNLQWRARVRRKGYPIVSKTFEKKSDAEAWAREIENEMDRGIFISRKEAEQYTLKEGLDRYIEEYVPRLKHSEFEIRRIRVLQKHPLAHRIMATSAPKILPTSVKTGKHKESNPIPSVLTLPSSHGFSIMPALTGVWKVSLIL